MALAKNHEYKVTTLAERGRQSMNVHVSIILAVNCRLSSGRSSKFLH
jgi:hypothetical protein